MQSNPWCALSSGRDQVYRVSLPPFADAFVGANPCQRQLHGMRTGTPRRTMVVWPRSKAPWSRMRSVVARPLCSRFDEKRDSDEANNHQGGTSGEHVTNMMSRGARSHGYLVVFSDDRTFVRIHGRFFLGA